MYVAIIPNRGSPPAILLRESYREAGKTKNRTLANLSRWPAERIEQLRAVLRGDKLLPAAEAVEIVRALPHGHVLAALGTARRIALDAVLPRRAPQRRRDLALALIIARLLEPAAKLATARMLDPATASHSLGEMLGLGRVTAKEVYAALDWLGREQPFIEAQLASIGSLHCGRRRSSSWPPKAGRCSPRCLTTAIWRRSPAPTTRANAWWSAKTRCSPKSGPANAPSCWPPPKRSSRASRPACRGRAVHCAAPRQSARRSAPCWDGATWPSISRSASPTRRSASPETRSALPRRPRSTASM